MRRTHVRRGTGIVQALCLTLMMLLAAEPGTSSSAHGSDDTSSSRTRRDTKAVPVGEAQKKAVKAEEEVRKAFLAGLRPLPQAASASKSAGDAASVARRHEEVLAADAAYRNARGNAPRGIDGDAAHQKYAQTLNRIFATQAPPAQVRVGATATFPPPQVPERVEVQVPFAMVEGNMAILIVIETTFTKTDQKPVELTKVRRCTLVRESGGPWKTKETQLVAEKLLVDGWAEAISPPQSTATKGLARSLGEGGGNADEVSPHVP